MVDLFVYKYLLMAKNFPSYSRSAKIARNFFRAAICPARRRSDWDRICQVSRTSAI